MHGVDGLSAADVKARTAAGLTNTRRVTTSRSTAEIVRANLLTRFNLMLGFLFVVVLVARSPVDGLFGIVVVTNAVIGITQEMRAKKKLDELSFAHAPVSRVVRDGTVVTIETAGIVLDDLVLLRAGDVVPADGSVVVSDNLEVNESNLTGESDPVARHAGEPMLSGTHVTAGSGSFVATTVGESATVNRLTTEARAHRRTTSEIEHSLNRILVWVTWIALLAVPLQVLSLVRTRDHGTLRKDTLASVSGLVGIIPEGLVLLSTLTFLSAAVTLGRRNVLVQELPAVEVLARVTVVCLDKTGTLTTGEIEYESCEFLVPDLRAEVCEALTLLSGDADANSTMRAVARAHPGPPRWAAQDSIPFDSTRKWKAVDCGSDGAWFLGAPEILSPDDQLLTDRVGDMARSGLRVLLLCRSATWPVSRTLPDDLRAVAIVSLRERTRPHVRETLAHFAAQGVRIIVMSGDNPHTVEAIARDAGLAHTGAVDARLVGNDEMAAAVRTAHVFGRVTPEQKRDMVRALQADGHVVAMTGDGVNDVLALKHADLGIAMGAAVPATRAIAQCVLLDDSFDSLPAVLAEGRRVIGNVERVAQLFMAKNSMSFVAIVCGAALGWAFPIQPRQMTLLSSVTVGVPAFFLALGANNRRFTPGFLRRIVTRSWPVGAVIGVSVVASHHLSGDSTGTAASLTAFVCFLALLAGAATPLRGWRIVLVVSAAVVSALCFLVPPVSGVFGFDATMRDRMIALVASLPACAVIIATGVAARHRSGASAWCVAPSRVSG